MKENHKIIYYSKKSKNKKTETYKIGDTLVTKNFYNAKDAYVKELIEEENGLKEIKHFTEKGILAKMEHFAGDKREGIETKYFISKANRTVKSTKTYSAGKLHGECITYGNGEEIVKQEVYALGKLVFKYLRNNGSSGEITNYQIVDKDNIDNLPKIEYDKLQEYLVQNPDWFM